MTSYPTSPSIGFNDPVKFEAVSQDGRERHGEKWKRTWKLLGKPVLISEKGPSPTAFLCEADHFTFLACLGDGRRGSLRFRVGGRVSEGCYAVAQGGGVQGGNLALRSICLTNRLQGIWGMIAEIILFDRTRPEHNGRHPVYVLCFICSLFGVYTPFRHL